MALHCRVPLFPGKHPRLDTVLYNMTKLPPVWSLLSHSSLWNRWSILLTKIYNHSISLLLNCCTLTLNNFLSSLLFINSEAQFQSIGPQIRGKVIGRWEIWQRTSILHSVSTTLPIWLVFASCVRNGQLVADSFHSKITCTRWSISCVSVSSMCHTNTFQVKFLVITAAALYWYFYCALCL